MGCHGAIPANLFQLHLNTPLLADIFQNSTAPARHHADGAELYISPDLFVLGVGTVFYRNRLNDSVSFLRLAGLECTKLHLRLTATPQRFVIMGKNDFLTPKAVAILPLHRKHLIRMHRPLPACHTVSSYSPRQLALVGSGASVSARILVFSCVKTQCSASSACYGQYMRVTLCLLLCSDFNCCRSATELKLKDYRNFGGSVRCARNNAVMRTASSATSLQILIDARWSSSGKTPIGLLMDTLKNFTPVLWSTCVGRAF